RMVTYVILISTFVVGVDQFFKAFYPDISKALGPYVALIITNCLIMGRAEAFASKNPVNFSTIDAFAHGMGYTVTLILIGIVREVLAFGTLMNIRVVGENWTNWVVMAMAPGGFFILALIVWGVKTVQLDESEKQPVKTTISVEGESEAA
ncbi:MAG: Rnf-Nqr domain containing protein, partial [Halanaerobiales bacterium]